MNYQIINKLLAALNECIEYGQVLEFVERIDEADELLESFLEGFLGEKSQVQRQLLSTIVELFLKRLSFTWKLFSK